VLSGALVGVGGGGVVVGRVVGRVVGGGVAGVLLDRFVDVGDEVSEAGAIDTQPITKTPATQIDTNDRITN